MTQGRGSSQIGKEGPIGHPHAIFTMTVSAEEPVEHKSGDLWVKLVTTPAVLLATSEEDDGG